MCWNLRWSKEERKEQEKQEKQEIVTPYNEKLNHTNFTIWKFKMTCVYDHMLSYNFQDVITTTEVVGPNLSKVFSTKRNAHSFQLQRELNDLQHRGLLINDYALIKPMWFSSLHQNGDQQESEDKKKSSWIFIMRDVLTKSH